MPPSSRQLVLVGFLQAQNCTTIPAAWRHPDARLYGVDVQPAMLEAARAVALTIDAEILVAAAGETAEDDA